jgi:formylglycine-generating enzyme required for sulfatase activity
MVKTMNILVKGNVKGIHLLGSVLMAGRNGVKVVVDHHKENPARLQAWERTSGFAPQVMLGRASLNYKWQQATAATIDTTMTVDTIRQLLRRVFASNKGKFIEFVREEEEDVNIRDIERFLQPRLPKIQKEMVLVPAGKFLYGQDKAEMKLPAFLIDKYPVTNAMYSLFMKFTEHEPPAFWDDPNLGIARPDHPVVGVNFFDAWDFARWLGMKLPTEHEWEKAARGTDGRIYPWGNKFNVKKVVHFAAHSTAPVNAYLGGASPYGVMDMAGNVSEWTDSIAQQPDHYIYRGGSWRSHNTEELCTYYRLGKRRRIHWFNCLGFRTASDPCK